MPVTKGQLVDGTTAVVLGASLGGMLAAAALARHLDHVIIVERDKLPDGPEWRRGSSQSRHAHNLMMAGHLAMDELLPGLQQELVTAGMVKVRMPKDMLLLTAGGWMPRFPTDLFMMTSSRDLIDWVVRSRLIAHPRVEFRQETEAVELLGGTDGESVRGVSVRSREAGTATGWGEPTELLADFVVDSTGRKSRAPEWLRRLGYDAPKESVVDAQVGYATCVFAPPAGHQADWNCILLQSTPDSPRQGILNPIENGNWMVSLAAMGGKRPPLEHEAYLEFAKSLRSPILYEVLRNAEPLTPIHGSGRTENRRRHYERLRRWPDRFIVLGDGIGALNPSYGQGMSVAARSAICLDRALAKAGTPAGIAGRVRREIAKCVDLAWTIAATGDLAYPWALKDAGLSTRMTIRYLYRVIACCPSSEAASTALLDVNQMVAGPQAFFRPRVVSALLRGPRKTASREPVYETVAAADGAGRTVSAPEDQEVT